MGIGSIKLSVAVLISLLLQCTYHIISYFGVVVLVFIALNGSMVASSQIDEESEGTSHKESHLAKLQKPHFDDGDTDNSTMRS